ncbi:MAG: GH3 auxin-responsive promoter family protein [Deltaproteobacteria bacterium]|nr:GH3 auxin-responsive promoter family protein [Deltaproteobacteria bacterium]
MLAGLVKGVVSRFSDDGIRSLGRLAFSRTTGQVTAACADPRGTQTRRLLDITTRNANTERGRALGFSSIHSLEDWRAKIPLCDWDDVSPFIERMVQGETNVLVDEDPIYYATTSGTTGRRKLIPVTSAFVAECRNANRVLYRSMLQAMPGLVRGKRLSMRSPGTEKISARAEAGSITVALGGFDGDNVLDAVPSAVFSVPDFAARYVLALRAALQEHITVASAVNPSTLHLFAEVLANHGEDLARSLDSGTVDVDVPALRSFWKKDPAAARRVRESAMAHGKARMQDAFPALCGLVTWKGGTSSWWLQRLLPSYGALPLLDYGYAASEGCFGAPLSCDDASSLLLPHGHLIELQPESGGETVFLDEAKIGERYAVVVTTSSGLYRYRMHDIVEVTAMEGKAPLVVFRHKEGTMTSITGEKLGEAHVAQALASLGFDGAGICLAPLYRDEGPPGYVAAIEAGVVVDAAAFDLALCAANEEYDAKRKSLRLGPVVVVAVGAGSFLRARREKVELGAPDAHVKLPMLSRDGAFLVDLGVADDVVRGLPCRRSRS